MNDSYPLIMTQEYWANSQFSIAKYYGGVNFNGHRYVIVNKEGKDVWECSKEAEKVGRETAIEPGEPADLCIVSLVPSYRKLGRDKIIELAKQGKSEDEIKAIAFPEEKG